MSLATTLFAHPSYLRGRHDLLKAIQRGRQQIQSVKKSQPEVLKKFAEEVHKTRGRPLFYHALFSGLGNGALVELIDGSIKYDFITGIGTHFFGHSDLDLIATAVQAASQNVVMQGNLQLGQEGTRFLAALLNMAGPRFSYGWLSASGSFANDNALKIIQHKKSPAHKVVAFTDCFHGRTLAMAQITDNEAYRKGLHQYGDTLYVPFYDPADDQSTEKAVKALKHHIQKNKGEIAAFIFELVQGEGGFKQAPKAFFVALMDVCRQEKIAIWVDEIQTVGRTGELFAFHKLGLDEYVDVVTVGKMLQSCATLYTEEFNPKPGLLAGTFTGSTVSLAVAHRILERFQKEKFFGPKGKISKMETWIRSGLDNLRDAVGQGTISNITTIGVMASWVYKDGSLEQTKKLIFKAFEEGVMLFSCGRGPYKIRFLLPGGVLRETEYKNGLKRIEKAINGLN